MEELVAHELGMAMALCSLGAEMVAQYRDLLKEHKDESQLDKAEQTFRDHTQRSERLTEMAGASDEARKVREAADKNFRAMHESFFEGMPDDAIHVLTWMAMANAGGIAIWAALEGAADETGDKELEELSNEALEFQKSELSTAEKILHDLARAKT